MTRLRGLLALVAMATAVIFFVAEADARGAKGGSFGSRGTRTQSAPPPTATAPNAAAPMQRSATQPSAAATGVGGAAAAAPAAGRGMMGGMMGGLLGAGLIGAMLGYGLSGGLGGLASIFGLLLQIGLIVGIGALAWMWWQRRQQQHAPAGVPRGMYEGDQSQRRGLERTGLGGLGGGSGAAGYGAMGAGGAMATPSVEDNISIGKDDYDDFERILSDVQGAYSNEDVNALRKHATPEMVSYFAEELAENSSRGVVNQVSGVKLLQGDMAEAWREGNTDYATVAMRFELVDKTVDRASGRVVEGDDKPVDVTELWTFRRSTGGAWQLSAIQQA